LVTLAKRSAKVGEGEKANKSKGVPD